MADGGSGQPWRDLAAVLLGLRTLLPDLGQVAGDEPGAAVAFVTDLLRYLTGPAGGDWVDTVAARLFDLHVARYVMQPDGVVADQALELIQMSSDTRTSLDPRTLAQEKLTGLQLHHFGAFCKASWRANDWMWGRLTALAGWCTCCSTRAGCTPWPPRPMTRTVSARSCAPGWSRSRAARRHPACGARSRPRAAIRPCRPSWTS